MDRPAFDSALSVAGTGPTPMTSGSTPAKANETIRIFVGRPCSLAPSAEASRLIVAPSLRPAALPAVTRPCGRNGVFSAARASSVVPGRGGSSVLTTSQPSPLFTSTGIMSGCSLPAAQAAA